MAKAKMNWVKLENRNSMVDKGTQYRNLQAWQSNCALCGIEFIEHTPGRSPPDQPPTVTTCEEHRGAPTCITYGWAAWDGKNVTPGPRMKIGAVSGSVAGAPVQGAEFDELKKENAEYADAIGENLALIGQLRRELDATKAKLAEYELQPRMAAMQNKMPWQS